MQFFALVAFATAAIRIAPCFAAPIPSVVNAAVDPLTASTVLVAGTQPLMDKLSADFGLQSLILNADETALLEN